MSRVLKHKHMEKNLGSINGRQETVDALIGNEHYPTIRPLWTHSDWLRKLSQRTLFVRLGLQERESKRVTDRDLLTQKGLQTDLLTQTIALRAMPLQGRQPQKLIDCQVEVCVWSPTKEKKQEDLVDLITMLLKFNCFL